MPSQLGRLVSSIEMATETIEGDAQARTSLAEQRRALPDQPGVYLFRDARGRVIYVGKAKSVRKRVASHFSKAQVPSSPGTPRWSASIEHIECVVVATEAEALLAEQNFIKQYRPRFNIRLRDDKSYPFIAISLDEDFPRVYFTRERHRRDRAYFGPYSNAKRVRGTLDVLGKVFMFRSCTGPEPGRRSGSPCLDYYIKRCEAPCVGYVSKRGVPRRDRRRASTSSPGRFGEIERELEQRMRAAAAAEEFEQATVERNRLRAVRSLLERQRVANDVGRHVRRDRRRVDGARGQRAGLPGARRRALRPPVLLPRQRDRARRRRGGRGVHAPVLRRRTCRSRRCSSSSASVGERPVLAEALARRRGGPVEIRAAERGEKRRILELAERNARLALDQERLQVGAPPPEPRRGARRPAAGARPRRAADADRVLRHLPPRRHAHGRLDGRVRGRRAEEVRLPPLHDPQPVEGESDDFAAMAEVLARRFAQWERQADISPHDPAYDASFAALPNLVVIDGGKGQLAAGLGAAARLPRPRRRRDLAGQADRGGLHPRPPRPARARPRHARAAAAAARPRRGAPLRDHPPPQPPRQGDDRARCSTSCPASAPRASARCSRTSARPRRVLVGLQRGAAGGARAAREGRRASCTRTCTAPAEPALQVSAS